MKAAQLISYGGKDSIQINDIPTPAVGDDEILVKIHAAGVNPFDWKIQNGYLKEYIPLTFPITLGGDLSGVVMHVGKNVTQFKAGDTVYGQANILAGGSGTFAEFATTTAGSLAYLPKSLSFEQAAGLPLAGVSVLQALIEHMKLEKGQKILIHGGAGGIGSIAIQIAKHIGAVVATTASTQDLPFVKTLGPDQLIDYKTQKFEDSLHDYDAVFDTVGGETTTRSLTVLKNGGILVSMAGQVDPVIAKEKNITVISQMTKISIDKLEKLSSLVDAGKIKVNVEKTFPFAQTAQALDYIKNTPPQGKVVITFM